MLFWQTQVVARLLLDSWKIDKYDDSVSSNYLQGKIWLYPQLYHFLVSWCGMGMLELVFRAIKQNSKYKTIGNWKFSKRKWSLTMRIYARNYVLYIEMQLLIKINHKLLLPFKNFSATSASNRRLIEW